MKIPFSGSLLQQLRINGETSHALAGGSASVLFLIVANAIVGLLSQVTLTRTLGVSEYGRYSVALSWGLAIAAPTMAGLDASILRFASRYIADRQGPVLRRFALFTMAVQLSTVLLSTLLVAFTPIRNFALGSLRVGIWPLALFIASTAFLGSFSVFFTAFRRFVFSQFYQNLLRPLLLIAAVLIAVFVAKRHVDAEFALTVTAITSFAALVVLVFHLSLSLKSVSGAVSGTLERRRWFTFTGLAQAGSVAQQSAAQLPIILIGFLSTPTEAGHFAVAARLATLVTFGLSAVGIASAPMISAAHARHDFKQIGHLASLAARLATVVATCALIPFVFAGQHILMLFGTGFSGAYLPLAVLMLGAFFNAFCGVNSILLGMTDQPGFAVAALLIGAATNAFLSYVLIPSFGALGAAIGTVVGTILSNALMVWRIYRILRIDSTALGLSARLQGREGVVSGS